MSIIIELSGVSCSGKSTVFPIILDWLNQGDYKSLDASQFINSLAVKEFENFIKKSLSDACQMFTISMLRKCLIASNFLRTDLLRQHIRVAGYVYKYGHSFKCFKSYITKLGMHCLIQKTMKNQRVLIDEGIVHTVQSIFVSQSIPGKSKCMLRNNLEAYLTSIPLPDILVVVYNRDQEELNHRLRARGHHRIKVTNPSVRKQFIENCVYVEELTLDILSSRRKIKIIKIPIENIDCSGADKVYKY